MIKTPWVRKQNAQPQGKCQPFCLDWRPIERYCGAQFSSNTAKEVVSLRGDAALQGELQRKEP